MLYGLTDPSEGPTTRSKHMGKTAAAYDKALNEAEEFEEVKGGGDFPPVHDFNETPELIGTFLGTEVKTIKGDDRTIHSFDVDGTVTQAWGASILDSRLADVEVGQRVKVVKTGKKLTTKAGRTPWEFKVFVSRAHAR